MQPNPASIPQQGGRNCNRLKMDITAALVLTHETRSCLLVNVASYGARVRMREPLAKGRTAIFTFHELRIYCSVVWSRGQECGLRFEKEIEPEDMQGFLWITQNRRHYERLCQESRAADWSAGIGD